MKRLLLISFMLLAGLIIAAPSLAQAPAWSRGLQNLSISHEECVKRARLALEAEGYTIENQGGGTGDYYFAGYKGIHSAIIACNSGPDGKTWANIFVASQSGDGTVPGAERVKLQQRMDQSPGSSSSEKWLLTLVIPTGQPYAGSYTVELNLTERNGNLTGSGTWSNGATSNFTGEVKNNEIVLYRVDANGFRSTFTGKGTADGLMEGTGSNDPSSPGGNNAIFTWNARRLQ